MVVDSCKGHGTAAKKVSLLADCKDFSKVPSSGANQMMHIRRLERGEHPRTGAKIAV